MAWAAWQAESPCPLGKGVLLFVVTIEIVTFCDSLSISLYGWAPAESPCPLAKGVLLGFSLYKSNLLEEAHASRIIREFGARVRRTTFGTDFLLSYNQLRITGDNF